MIPANSALGPYDFVHTGEEYEQWAADRDKVGPAGGQIWKSTAYQAIVTDIGDTGWTWLSIKKLGKGTIRKWRELQRIKTALVGPDRDAVELFPAEWRHVDSANQYHLWVLPEGSNFPFGFGERAVVYGDEDAEVLRQRMRDAGFAESTIEQTGMAVQSEFDPEARVADLLVMAMGCLREAGIPEKVVEDVRDRIVEGTTDG